MAKITLHSDGACSGNPGKGGWGAIIKTGDNSKEMSKGYELTTNNRMELLGIIEPLETIQETSEIDIYTDSQYVVNPINKGWLQGWIRKGWKGSNKKAVKNIDLWKRFVTLLEKHQITMHWIKGHDNNKHNEKCDKLAVDARSKDKLKIDMNYIWENNEEVLPNLF